MRISIFKKRFIKLPVKDQLASACNMQEDLDNGTAKERYNEVTYLMFVNLVQWAIEYAMDSAEKIIEKHGER